jgi:hypothetical protein
MDWKTGLETELNAIEAEARSRSLFYSQKLVESLSDIEERLELVKDMVSIVEVTTDTAIKKFQAHSNQKLQSLSSSFERVISEDELVPMDTEIDDQLRSRLAYLESFRSDLLDFLYKRKVLNEGRSQILPLLRRLKEQWASLPGHSVVDGVSGSVKTKKTLSIQQAIRDDIDRLVDISESVLQKIRSVERSSGKTTLHYAALNNSSEVAMLSIKRGADNADTDVANADDSSGQKPAIGSPAGVSSRRVRYRSDLHGTIKSDKEGILEVLSDGVKRNLHQIAQEVWEINDDELDDQYERVRRTLSSTLAREFKRRTVFRPSRGEYSTCRFTSAMQAIRKALQSDIVEVLNDDWRNHPGLKKALEEFDSRETDKSIHRTAQQSMDTFEPRPITQESKKTLLSLIKIDPLSIPLLGVETKIIKKNGGQFIFETSEIASLDTRKRIDSEGEATIGAPGRTASAQKKYLRDNEENLFYNEDSTVIGYLNENVAVQEEIRAFITVFALRRLRFATPRAEANKRLLT